MCGRTQRSRFADELCSFAWTLATLWAFSGEILHSMRPVGHGTGRPNLGQVRDAPLPASGAFCIACSLLSFSFFFFLLFFLGEGVRKDEGEAQMHEACWLPWGKCGTGRRMPFAVCRCRSPRVSQNTERVSEPHSEPHSAERVRVVRVTEGMLSLWHGSSLMI